eukprot:12124-Pelagococcus_subviridis.AAC.1
MKNAVLSPGSLCWRLALLKCKLPSSCKLSSAADDRTTHTPPGVPVSSWGVAFKLPLCIFKLPS